MDNFHLFLNTHLNKQPQIHLEDYKIVRGTLFSELGVCSFEKDVNELARLGYIPCGSFSSTKAYGNGMLHETTLYQAMCLYARKDETE